MQCSGHPEWVGGATARQALSSFVRSVIRTYCSRWCSRLFHSLATALMASWNSSIRQFRPAARRPLLFAGTYYGDCTSFCHQPAMQ